jgi:putative cell wall-binding protein
MKKNKILLILILFNLLILTSCSIDHKIIVKNDNSFDVNYVEKFENKTSAKLVNIGDKILKYSEV